MLQEILNSSKEVFRFVMIFFNDSFVAPVRLKSIDVILLLTVGFMKLLNTVKIVSNKLAIFSKSI